jgi:hypothetical protein
MWIFRYRQLMLSASLLLWGLVCWWLVALACHVPEKQLSESQKYELQRQRRRERQQEREAWRSFFESVPPPPDFNHH